MAEVVETLDLSVIYACYEEGDGRGLAARGKKADATYGATPILHVRLLEVVLVEFPGRPSNLTKGLTSFDRKEATRVHTALLSHLKPACRARRRISTDDSSVSSSSSSTTSFWKFST